MKKFFKKFITIVYIYNDICFHVSYVIYYHVQIEKVYIFKLFREI